VEEAGESRGRPRARLLHEHEQLGPAGAQRGHATFAPEQLQPHGAGVVVERAVEIGDGQVHRPERHGRLRLPLFASVLRRLRAGGYVVAARALPGEHRRTAREGVDDEAGHRPEGRAGDGAVEGERHAAKRHEPEADGGSGERAAQRPVASGAVETAS
jgi:hypothetical protein